MSASEIANDDSSSGLADPLTTQNDPDLTSCKKFFEINGNSTHRLLSMHVGQQTNEEGVPFLFDDHQLFSCTKQVNYKPTNTHLCDEIRRCVQAYPQYKSFDPRPSQWKCNKLLNWLVSNPIPSTAVEDVAFLSSQIDLLREHIFKMNKEASKKKFNHNLNLRAPLGTVISLTYVYIIRSTKTTSKVNL